MVFYIIYYFLYILEILLVIRVLLSWIRLPKNGLTELLYTLTEPVLGPIRHLVQKSIFGGRKGGLLLDISPLIAFIFLDLIQNYVSIYVR